MAEFEDNEAQQVPELFAKLQDIRNNAVAAYRPEGYFNNSQYNDLLNYAPSEMNPGYDTGRQDEEGNPIRGSLVNDYYNGTQPAAPEAQPLGNGVVNTTGNLFDNISAGMKSLRQGANENIAAAMEMDPLSALGSGVMWLHDAVKNNASDNFKTSKVYADLFYGAEERRDVVEKATELYKQGLINVNPDTLPKSNEAGASEIWAKMMKQVQLVERLQSMKDVIPGAVTPDGQVDMRKVLSAFPEVKDILETRGTNAAVMALHEIKGLKSVHDAYNNDISRFIGSVGIGVQRGANNFVKQLTTGKAMLGATFGLRNEGLTKNEQEYLRNIDKENEKLGEYSYATVGAGLGGMIGSAFENAPMILSSQAARMAATAGITAAGIASAPVAAAVGAATAVAVMALEIGGSQYEQNINKVDKDGRRMYTTQQAGIISLLQGASEGVLEQYALGQIGRAMTGRAAIKELADLYGGNAAKTLALSVGKEATEAEIKAATRTLVGQTLKDMAEAGVVSFRAELFEEFEQQVSDMVIENMAQLALKGEKAELSSVQDIIGQSIMAAAEAVPAVAGFGIMGMAGHAGMHRQQILKPQEYLKGLQNDLVQNALHNQDLMEKIEAVGGNLENIKELQDKAPGLVQEILDSNNERAGIKDTVVDIKSLKQEAGGEAMVQEIAKQAGVSAEELQACEQGTGMLNVKTSVLMQISSTAEEAGKKALFRNITKSSLLETTAQQEQRIKWVKEAMEAMKGKPQLGEAEAAERYVKNLFEGEENADAKAALALDILRADINHPAAEIKKRLDAIGAEIDGELGSTIAQLQNGMKQGVDIALDDEGRGSRWSNNAEWYRNFYEDFGRAPTKAELESLAYDIATGQATRYTDGVINDGSPEAQAYFDGVKAKLDDLMAQRKALQAVAPTLKDIGVGDVQATATFSQEGRAIYHFIMGQLAQGNKKVQSAARQEAYLAVSMAEFLAAREREAGGQNITVAQFVPGLVANAEENGLGLIQMAGERAAFKLDEEMRPVYLTGKLDEAKEMEASGISANDIWKKTGWMLGRDGKWRFEIPDNLDAINIEQYANGENESALLGSLYDNPLLFEAYPDLAEVVVFMQPISTAGGYVVGNTISINNYKTDAEKMKEVLIHEIQHIIQRKEGFAVGGNAKSVVQQMNQRVDLLYKELHAGLIDKENAAHDQMELLKEYTANIVQSNVAFFSNDLDTAQKYTDAAEKNLAELQKLTPKVDVQQIISVYEDMKAIASDIDAYYSKSEAERKDIAYNYYWRLAGEQEARFTANRAKAKSMLKQKIEDATTVKDRYNKMYNSVGQNVKAMLDQYIALEKQHEQAAEDKDEALMSKINDQQDEIFDAIESLEGGEDVSNLLSEYLYSSESKESLEQRLKEFEEGLPQPHSVDGIVVFGGQEYNAASLGDSAADATEYLYDLRSKINQKIAALQEYIVKSLKNYSGLKDFKMVRKVAAEEAEIIQERLGYDVHGYTHVINQNDLRHILNIHGEGKENKKDHIPLTEYDLFLIPEIISAPDDIEQGSISNEGYASIRYLRTIGNETTYVVEVIMDAEKKLSTKTMWKEKSPIAASHDAGGTPHYTSETDASTQKSLSAKKSISRGTRNRKQKYYQSVKGAYNQTQNLISLFQAADQSTFAHESAHAFLTYLEQLSIKYPDSRAAKDYATIKAWAEWKDGAAAEYAGTASAGEFAKREAEIKEALKNGFVERTVQVNGQEQTIRLSADELKAEWLQERFARGFEEYLRSGEAPTSALRQTFQKFKRWLRDIYRQVTGAGVRATPEVEAIMARMVASEEEIEAYNLLKRAKRIQDVDADLLDTDTQAMLQRWEDQAKERAKEVLLAQLIKDYEAGDIKQHMADYAKVLEQAMANMDVFKAEAVAKAQGEQAVVALGFYPTVEAYRQELAFCDGGYDAYKANELKAEEESYKKRMPNAAQLRQMAEDAVNSGVHQTRLAALEAEILGRRIEKYANAPKKLALAMDEVEAALQGEAEPLKKAILALKYAFNWEAKQAEQIAMLQDLVEELKQSKQEGQKEIRDKMAAQIADLKKTTMQNKAWLRGVRDAAKGKVAAYRTVAKQKLAGMTVGEATNTRAWSREADKAAQECLKKVTKAVQEKDAAKREALYKEAQQAKIRQVVYTAMVSESLKMKRRLDMVTKQLKQRGKTVVKNKRIDAKHKYFINHALYLFGLKSTDAITPLNVGTLQDLLEELKNGGLVSSASEGIINDASAQMPTKSLKAMKMAEVEDLKDLIDFLYVTGDNAGRLFTSDETVAEIVVKLLQAHRENVAQPSRVDKNGKKVDTGMNSYMAMLMKPEMMLQVMDGQSTDNIFVKYIYGPLFKGMDAQRELKEKSAEELRTIFDAWLPYEERGRLTEEIDKLPDGEALTKENIIAMALNWGNKANRSRLVAGIQFQLRGQQAYSEADVLALFAKHMTANDWTFVQNVWDYIGQYGDMVDQVVQDCTGNPMKRVEADAFDVQVQDGSRIHVKGGYYPIKRDPARSAREQELQANKPAAGGARMGQGMGSTKNRAANEPNKGPLLLSMNVLNDHVDQQIHIITMRKATLDAYRLLRQQPVADMLEDTLGADAPRKLETWVEDVWSEPLGESDVITSWMEQRRALTVKAIMAGRVSIGLLNFANIVPMCDKLGIVNALSAVAEFMAHPQQVRQFVMQDSSYMRARAENMDRDLKVQQHNLMGGNKLTKLEQYIDKYANWFTVETDLLTGVPTYNWVYRTEYNKAIGEGEAEDKARSRAHFAATEAVRNILGSADSIDQAEIQRKKSLFIKSITPFFSFFNAQMNAVWVKYYQGKYAGRMIEEQDAQGNKRYIPVREAFIKRYAHFAESYLFRFVLMAGMETIIRTGINAITASHDDKPDKEDWYKKLLKEWMLNSLDSQAGGFPIINAAIGTIARNIMGEKSFESRGVADAAVERVLKPVMDISKSIGKGKGIDGLELLRDMTKGIGGSLYGVPDTLTDAFWNSVRFAKDEYHFANPADLREYIGRTLLDKRLKPKDK